MRDSLITMNGYIGLGTKALKISNAVPKPKGVGDTPTNGQPSGSEGSNFNQYYDPTSYWQNYAANWQQVNYFVNFSLFILYKLCGFQQGYLEQGTQGQVQPNPYIPPPEQKKEDDLELIGKYITSQH